nr:hypothetical protein [Delftia acidovorans]
MTSITETLCAIERRAERAIVQELRLMAKEILAMRTQLTLQDRAHADALLLKLSHLESCQQVAPAAPSASPLIRAPEGLGCPLLALETLEPLQPSTYLIHLYHPDVGDLECVELTESLATAIQLAHQRWREQPRDVSQVTRDNGTGRLSLLTSDGLVLVSILPCEPRTPEVEACIADACSSLALGDVAALRRLFVAPVQARPRPQAA